MAPRGAAAWPLAAPAQETIGRRPLRDPSETANVAGAGRRARCRRDLDWTHLKGCCRSPIGFSPVPGSRLFHGTPCSHS